MCRQVGNKNMQQLSKMTDANRRLTWAIIGPKGVDALFMPTNAFVCKACAGKVRYAQSVSNSSVPRPEPEPVPQPKDRLPPSLGRNLLTALLQAARARRFWTASSVTTRGP